MSYPRDEDLERIAALKETLAGVLWLTGHDFWMDPSGVDSPFARAVQRIMMDEQSRARPEDEWHVYVYWNGVYRHELHMARNGTGPYAPAGDPGSAKVEP